jgi:hypothetical protein
MNKEQTLELLSSILDRFKEAGMASGEIEQLIHLVEQGAPIVEDTMDHIKLIHDALGAFLGK